MILSHRNSGQEGASVGRDPAGLDIAVAGPVENPDVGAEGTRVGLHTPAAAPARSYSSPADYTLGTVDLAEPADIHSAEQTAAVHIRWGSGVQVAAVVFGIEGAPRSTTWCERDPGQTGVSA